MNEQRRKLPNKYWELMNCDVGEIDRLRGVISDIKKHMKIVNPTGYKLSAVYNIACKGVPDE